jgi:hypothetical protein
VIRLDPKTCQQDFRAALRSTSGILGHQILDIDTRVHAWLRSVYKGGQNEAGLGFRVQGGQNEAGLGFRVQGTRIQGGQNQADIIEGLFRNEDKEADATCRIFALAPRSHVRCLALLLILPRVPISSIVVLFALTRLMW